MRKSVVARSTYVVGLALLASGCGAADEARFHHEVESGPTPWTHEQFDEPTGDLTFAVFSDLTGGERPGVFAKAAGRLALMRPALVMSVGDLIEGDSNDPRRLGRQWDSFDERAAIIPTPVFRVGGNHDISGRVRREVWAQRYGPHYYHFVFDDVLFLVLDTEDFTSSWGADLVDRVAEAFGGLVGRDLERAEPRGALEPGPPTGNIGRAQAAYFREVLAEHEDVRWTMVFLHRPVWKDGPDPDFLGLERVLAERPYTVFSGHHHSMSHTTRNGRDYYMLGTTGGFQIPGDPMSFDHITRVTVGDGKPSVEHLRLEDLRRADEAERR